jgi:threonine aldolase
VHLDGARIFNAAVALDDDVARMTAKVDSLMFCLSTGLGAPVGSMIAGSKEFIERARICRKMFGGGMRQVGVLAAAGLIALEKSPSRLYEDHENAKHLAHGIAAIPGLQIDPAGVKSNIVIFDCTASGMNAVELCDALHPKGIWAQDTAPYSVRMVTHWNVDRAGIDKALAELCALASKKVGRSA